MVQGFFGELTGVDSFEFFELNTFDSCKITFATRNTSTMTFSVVYLIL